MRRFCISATGHSLNYLPQYIGEWKGWFKESGLEYSVEVPRPWDLVLEHINRGDADAALGGIWVPTMYYGRSTRYVPFAQVSNHSPLALIGRDNGKHFSLEDLIDKVVLMKGSTGASAGIYLKMILKENKINPNEVNYIQDLDSKMLSELFAGGMGDYLVIDYPSALQFCKGNDAVIVASFPIVGGEIPWSVYYTCGFVDDNELIMQKKFITVLQRAMIWINSNPAEQYEDFLVREFPSFDKDVLLKVVNDYRSNHMWTTPKISVKGYKRWQLGIEEGFLVENPLQYDELIDSRAVSCL